MERALVGSREIDKIREGMSQRKTAFEDYAEPRKVRERERERVREQERERDKESGIER